MQEQLREILVMTRSMPADFRHLRSMVEQRHKTIARHALAQTPKAELVEEYLHDNDLLSRTAEGIAYRASPGCCPPLRRRRLSAVILTRC
jgi:hypothetical protein